MSSGSEPATRRRAPRSDAARNRAAVLDAADRLLRAGEQAGEISTAAVAEAAGVGKATLFRAFGDRAGLLRALFDERFVSLRERIEDGPPPLGPGADPRARILAVLDAVLQHKVDNRSLSMALERAADNSSPFVGAHYEPLHAVISAELRALGGAGDAEFAAHALLGAVRADLVEHLLGRHGWNPARLRGEVAAFASRYLDERNPPA